MKSLRRAAVVALTVAACGATGGATAAAPPGVAADVEHYLAELERIHPNPYHAVSRAEYRAAADRLIARLPTLTDDELLVELLRLVASLGERDGHANMNPLAPGHRRILHLYPIATYEFADGVYVVAAPGRPQLVGRRIAAIQGRPIGEVLRLVDPLVTFDNPLSLAAHRSPYLVTAEILHGLGITPTAERATLSLEGLADVELTPVTRGAYVTAMRTAFPLFLDGMPKRARPLMASRRGTSQWVTTLDRGRVVYFLYNTVLQDTTRTANRILRLARRAKTRRIVVDLRNNGGGDIGTYPYLLETLKTRAINRPGRLVVLIGRTTFSAAVHFATDLDQGTRAVFVGEPTGGSPNHYSDTDPVALEVSGYTINVPRIYFEKQPGRPGRRLDVDVAVPLTGRDFFAGRDPVLARALALR
jgi:Peptidase family S41